MNRLLFIFSFLIFFSCQNEKRATGTLIGEQMEENKAISAISLPDVMVEVEQKENLVLSGKVTDVCEKKGCWMKLDMEEGKEMRVTFKDYALFMPKNIVGKDVVIHGVASKKETSVEELKHYAEDAGKSEEEIAMITQPELELTFEADGVVIK